MLSLQHSTLAVLDNLAKTVAAAKRDVLQEDFGLSHADHANRIGLARDLSTALTGAFAEAVHAVNRIAILHKEVDDDYADVIEEHLRQLLDEGYDAAMTHQRELAAEDRHERLEAAE